MFKSPLNIFIKLGKDNVILKIINKPINILFLVLETIIGE